MQTHLWKSWGSWLTGAVIGLLSLSPVLAQESATKSDSPAETQAPTETTKPSSYWIGLQCFPVPAPLRAHLKLPDDQGLVVAAVVPGSPAMQAGIKPHDILVKANDKPLNKVQDLIDVVEAAKDQAFKIELLRGGSSTTVEAKPTKRPEEALAGPGMPGPEWDQMRRWLERARPGEDGRPPLRFRFFHPGTILPPGSDAGTLPDNMSITIHKEGKQPAKINVTRGGEKWEVTENELDKLPADVRPHVERLLGRGPHVMADQFQFFDFVPDWPPAATPESPAAPKQAAPAEGRMEKRLESLERRLDQMRKTLDEMRENRPRLRDRQEKAKPATPEKPAPEPKQEKI